MEGEGAYKADSDVTSKSGDLPGKICITFPLIWP